MDIKETQDQRIPVQGGITLSARIWQPEGAGPLPVILEALPYRKRDGTAQRDSTTHAIYAQHGYVCVRVDLRGNGDSDGLFDDEYSPTELRDIYDSIGWIADQPWCDGSIGIMGISWGGFNGLQVAAMNPPALKAVITICSTVDRFGDDIHYKGGCQLGENIGWAATAMSWFSTPPDPMIVGEAWRDIWMERLENTPFLAETWTAQNDRSDYWRHGSVCEDYSAITAAVLTIGGWHDGYRNTPAHLLANLEAPCKAIVGPWNHKYPHIAAPEPRIDYIHESLRWWDRWLKGIDTGVEAEPDYRAYLMDSVRPETSFTHRPGRWVGMDGPARAGVEMPFGAQGMGVQTPFVRHIATDLACGQGTGEYFPFGFGPGELPDDQSADDALSMCFDSAPSTGVDIIGAPEVVLHLSADQPRAQVAVRLCDLRPDGTSALISHGFLNLRHRNGFDAKQDVVAGEKMQVWVVLDQIAYALPKGHKLRIAISPSYWPFIWPEPAPVTLECTGGALFLPVWDGKSQPMTAFRAVPPPPEPVQIVTREGAESQKRTNVNRSLALRIAADHGEVTDVSHGLKSSSALEEVWEISRDDPASARVNIRWERGMGRGDWQVSTRCEMSMQTDADTYHIAATLSAHDGPKEVFNRTYTAVVPR